MPLGLHRGVSLGMFCHIQCASSFLYFYGKGKAPFTPKHLRRCGPATFFIIPHFAKNVKGAKWLFQKGHIVLLLCKHQFCYSVFILPALQIVHGGPPLRYHQARFPVLADEIPAADMLAIRAQRRVAHLLPHFPPLGKPVFHIRLSFSFDRKHILYLYYSNFAESGKRFYTEKA